jgi:tRNA1(Val) A37 N6-methylase TrmN6
LAEVALDVRLRVLDPACGDGALLTAVADLTPASVQVDLVGCDTDSAALAAADRRLSDLGKTNVSWTLEACDFLAEAVQLREQRESLFGSQDVKSLTARFDVVVANPPYVRTQTLGAEESRRLAATFGLEGRVDLYHAFAVAMTECLREQGVLALLCSNRFMTTKGGTSLRRYLQTTLRVERVYDLGDTKLFDAAVLPAVVVASRDRGTRAATMVSVYECPEVASASEVDSVLDVLDGASEEHVTARGTCYQVRRGHLRLNRAGDPWVLAGDAEAWVEQVDRNAAMRFGDLGKIRVGIKTTADSVFIRTDWADLGGRSPERDLLHPLLTHHSAHRWLAGEPLHRVLYPYDMDAAKRVPLEIEQWPRAAAYLAEHRDRLEGRRYVVEAGRGWWEVWVPQRPSEWAWPKLVFPDISDNPRFSLDRSGSIVNGDCYWLALTSEANERLGMLAMAVANSSLGTRYYDSVCGNKLYSGRRRYITQYVERFPLPDPETPEARKLVDLVGELLSGTLDDSEISIAETEVDGLVWRSFGFEEIPR